MNMSHAALLVIALPLFGAFLTVIAGLYRRSLCYVIATLATGLALVAAGITAYTVFQDGALVYSLGGWKAPVGIELVVDHLSAMLAVLVTFVSFTNTLQSRPIMQSFVERYGAHHKTAPFYALCQLLTAGLLGMTYTGDAFNLYVMLEITALATYALIALGGKRAYISTFHYIILGTIGASFYLLGVGYLYIMTGSLNMADLSQLIVARHASNTIFLAFVLIFIGVLIKSAFFPLHTWLPNAYADAPNHVSSLVAPLSTKVSVYVMIRLMFWVFSPVFVFEVIHFKAIMVFLAVVAILAGGIFALMQRNLKKMMCYIVVAEVGYMVGGVWLANNAGLTGAIFHIANDALVTMLVFSVAAMVYYRQKTHNISKLQGLFRKMPYSMTLLAIAALSIIGVPPTPGFFSKVYLITGAFTAEAWHFAAALIAASLLNAILFFRIFEYAFFQEGSHHDDEHIDAREDAPAIMLVATGAVAAALLALGLFSQTFIGKIIEPVVRSIFV